LRQPHYDAAAVRVAAALLFAVLAAFVAACGEGDDAPSAAADPTITTETRPEAVPTTTGSIGNAPVGLSGTELHVHGNMYGTLTDEAGNAMGVPDPAAGIQLTQTPGGSYLSTGDDEGGQYFIREGAFEGAWTVEEDDEVRFVVRNHADDEIAGAAATLPFVVRAGDKITMTLRTPADLGALELTVDGRTDRTIQFGRPAVGAGASDRFQPVSRVEVEHVDGPGGKQLARVTITASDNGGSGVARIEYGLTPSNEAGVYTKPIEVPAVGQIVVRAIDRAGNIQAPYSRVSLAP
jgi:hypothetical protein